MREFLLGLYLEHGERDFAYRSVYGTMFHKSYPEFIELIKRPKYNTELLPYKLTAKALEYIKAHD
jgi:hypothetical protein